MSNNSNTTELLNYKVTRLEGEFKAMGTDISNIGKQLEEYRIEFVNIRNELKNMSSKSDARDEKIDNMKKSFDNITKNKGTIKLFIVVATVVGSIAGIFGQIIDFAVNVFLAMKGHK